MRIDNYEVLQEGQDPTLIIDAGHGGRDIGGGHVKDILEKDLVLKISMYQYERFKQLGVPVALTRAKDVYLSSTVRTGIVKGSNAPYGFSNHTNAGGGDGAEFIHSIYAGDKLEQLMSEEIQKEGQNVRRIFTKQGKNGDYYFMHRETGKCHMTIIEYGFGDSTKDDVVQLYNEWQRYAEAIVRAFCKHIGVKYVSPTQAETEAFWDDMRKAKFTEALRLLNELKEDI